MLSKKSVLLIVAMATTLSSCRSFFGTSDSKTTIGIVASGKSKNVALLYTAGNAGGATPEERFGEYFSPDLRSLRGVFSIPDMGYTISVQEMKKNATSRDILTGIDKHVPDVGFLGTFILYIGGHGSATSNGNGHYNAEVLCDDDIPVNPIEILNRVRSARGDRPMKRLVLIISACKSGAWIEQLNSMKDHMEAARSLIPEVAVFAGSQHDVSVPIGPDGTSFIVGFTRAFRTLVDQNRKEATIADLLALTKTNMQATILQYQSHFKKVYEAEGISIQEFDGIVREPQFRGFPSNEAMLKEKLLVSDEGLNPTRLLLGVRYTANPINSLPGVFIETLVTSSAARDAGAKAGDLITQIDDTVISNVSDLEKFIAGNRKVGVTMSVKRPSWETNAWQWQDIKLELDLKTEMEAYDNRTDRQVTTYDLGITYQRKAFKDAKSKDYFGLEVTGFRDGDAAGMRRGLKKGDILYITNTFWTRDKKEYDTVFHNHQAVTVNVQFKRGDDYFNKLVLGLPK